ncbi:hypothetical protein AAAC51_44795 [Priestia megaterium]
MYIINEDNNTVSVLNGLTNDLITTINVGRQPSNVNGNSSNNRIYVTNKGKTLFQSLTQKQIR